MKRLSRQDVAPRPGAATAKASVAQDAARAGALRSVRIAAGLLVLASPALAAWGAWAWMTRTPGFAVRRIVVDGAVHCSEESVTAAAGALGANAFALDLQAVRSKLLADPWIADAVVRRALPHELRVSIVEREPAASVPARGDEPALIVDAEGRVLAEGPAAAGIALPLVTGLQAVPEAEREARRALGAATLHALRAAAPSLWARARTLDVSEPGRLVLSAEGCPPIWLSGPQSADEAAAWSRRENSIVQAIGRAAWVDARWRDRLHVMPLASGKGA